MYLSVDIGASKTLLAVFSDEGELLKDLRFVTPPVYSDFVQEVKSKLSNLEENNYHAACVAVPGIIDRATGIGLTMGNLTWTDIPIKSDMERLFSCPVVIENDAKLAGLSEAKLIKDRFRKVLYVTISTGIGYSLIINGIIDINISDAGGHTLMIEHDGKPVPWESFASGKAIKQKYGKLASEIDDPAIWAEITPTFAVGLIDLIATLQPEVVVIGGGVGAHFEKFAESLMTNLKAYEAPMLPIPPLVKAQHAEEAVIYGCYELAKERYGTPATT